MITLGLALIGAMVAQATKAADKVPGVGVQPDTYFYTGKPYDADLGSYVFACRDYNPQTNRWTTADPSGFPDGANNRVYAPVPSYQIDKYGLSIFDSYFSDDQGVQLFNHWIGGTGTSIVTSGGTWGEYMASNGLLPDQILGWLTDDFNNRSASGSLNLTKHAVIENGYSTGYEMLHGSNADVGDFTMKGTATVLDWSDWDHKAVRYDFTNTWNDKIDPNPTYFLDSVASAFLHLIYSPVDYTVSFSWDQSIIIE